MRIDDLRYLIRVADMGSISQAAEACYISQQGLSRNISSLEKELGVQLFQRQNNHIQLTSIGEIVVSYARQMDSLHQLMLTDISRMASNEQGHPPVDYHIYTSQLISATLLPKILSAINLRYPGINLNIIELTPPEIADCAEFTENTVGIISLSDFHKAQSMRLNSGELKYDSYFEDELMLGVAEQSQLAKRDCILAAELATIPLALCHTEAMMAQNLLNEGDSPSIALHISSYDLCREMVYHNRAAGLTSTLRDYYSTSSIKAIPVEKKIHISYGCIYNPSFPQSPFIRDLFSLVEKELSHIT